METTKENFGFETKSKKGAQFNGIQYAHKRSSNEWMTSNNFSTNQPTMNPISIDEIPSEVYDLIEEFEEMKISEKEKRTAFNIEMQKIKDDKRNEDNQRLQNLIANGPIPTTIDNLKLILNYLNEQNWGSWDLPAMTIGYSANQYDCDGTLATTITLSKGIEYVDYFDEKSIVSKFKVGGKRGHLEKYISLR